MKTWLNKLLRTKKSQEPFKLDNIPKIRSTFVPGGMTMEQWNNGGYSKYNHPEVKIRVLKAV